MNTLKIFISVILLHSVSTAVAWKSTEISVGDKTLLINYPDGYTNACEKSKEIKQLFSASLPQANVLVACFLEDKEFEIFPEVDSTVDNPVLHIQAIKSLSTRNLTSTEFNQIRSTIVEQQNKLFDGLPSNIKDINMEVSSLLSKLLSEPVSMDLESFIPLGVFSNTDKNIAYAMLRNSKISTDNEDILLSEIIAGNMILIENKLLLLHAAKTYTTIKDLEAIQHILLSWGMNLSDVKRRSTN